MRIDEALDYVQMRDGSAYMGTVTTAAFEVVIGGGAHLTLKREHLISIEMRSRTGLPKDRLHTKDGGQVVGDLLTKSIDFTSDETGVLKLALADVLVVQFTF
jgi:hypothetical protein